MNLYIINIVSINGYLIDFKQQGNYIIIPVKKRPWCQSWEKGTAHVKIFAECDEDWCLYNFNVPLTEIKEGKILCDPEKSFDSWCRNKNDLTLWKPMDAFISDYDKAKADIYERYGT